MANNEMIQNNMQKDQNKSNHIVEEKIDDLPLFKKKRILIPIFIILIAAAVAINWYIGELAYITTDDAFIDGNKLSVSAKMLGRITDLRVDEGDTVTKGQLLVQLDSTDLIAKAQQAKAILALDKESVSLAQVNLEKAQEDYARAEKQYKDKIIPKEQFDHIQKALESAKAQFNIAKIKIGTAQAQLNLIETQLLNTEIFSSMNGVIAKRWSLVGDVVAPGQPILTIYDIKNVWVTADLEETKLSSVKIGDKAELSVDAYPDQKFEGKIYQIGSNTASQFSLIPPSNAAGNFTKVTQRVPIKISIKPITESGKVDPNSSINLLPGMSVEIRVKVK